MRPRPADSLNHSLTCSGRRSAFTTTRTTTGFTATAAALFGGAAFGGKLRALFRNLRIPRRARSTWGGHGRIAWHALDHGMIIFGHLGGISVKRQGAAGGAA